MDRISLLNEYFKIRFIELLITLSIVNYRPMYGAIILPTVQKKFVRIIDYSKLKLDYYGLLIADFFFQYFHSQQPWCDLVCLES